MNAEYRCPSILIAVFICLLFPACLSKLRDPRDLSESRCVLVMNLHFNAHPKDLKTIFHQFGVINEIVVTVQTVHKCREDSCLSFLFVFRQRGQAFIVYDQTRDAEEAVIGGTTLQPISGACPSNQANLY